MMNQIRPVSDDEAPGDVKQIISKGNPEKPSDYQVMIS
jgi:hypothetical protein